MADPRLSDALARLPDYLGNHVLVSVTALAIGLGISLPLAILSLRRRGLRKALLALASIVQTIPGLALLALFYPLLLALSTLSEWMFGAGFSALGFLPSVLALALYSMLPVLRNTVTGLAGVDPAVLEAARGVGMTPRQSLRMVELPLALPVIMAGIRTAAVWVIGTATLATPIGQTSLGNYIFAGLQTQNWVFVVFGCFVAAILALVIDQLLAVMENGIRQRVRPRVAAGIVGLTLVVVASLGPVFSRPAPNVLIGAKPFAESYVLAALLQQRLADTGIAAQRREGLGSNVIFNALAAGDIDLYVDYSGTIWTTQMGRSEVASREQVLQEVSDWLARTHRITMAGALGFENAYALVMPRKQAEALGIRSIADLAPHAQTLSIAGDYEFFDRPEWKAIQQNYNLAFRNQRQMQAEFMYPAAGSGEVDVIAGYTSDGRIAQYDLVVLDDPKRAIPPYDAILLLSAKRGNDLAFIAALKPLVGAIDVSVMQQANRRVSDNRTPEAVAQWLWEQVRKK